MGKGRHQGAKLWDPRVNKTERHIQFKATTNLLSCSRGNKQSFLSLFDVYHADNIVLGVGGGGRGVGTLLARCKYYQ